VWLWLWAFWKTFAQTGFLKEAWDGRATANKYIMQQEGIPRNMHCTVLLLSNAPASLALSLNGVEGQTGPLFKGFASLPKGLNLLAYQESASVASPFSAILWWIAEEAGGEVESQSFALFKWNHGEMAFEKDTSVQQLSSEAFEENLLSRTNSLIPYELFMRKVPGSQLLWLSLTNFISQSVVERVFNQSHCIIEYTGATELSLTRIPSIKEFVQEHGLPASEVTKLACDSSRIFESLQRANLLAELQLAFVIFKYCMNMDCFDHWMRLLRLFCNSLVAANQCRSFVCVVMAQLPLVGEDASLLEYFTTDPIPRQLFAAFLALNEEDCEFDLAPLKEMLRSLFGWDACGDEAAAVVEQ